MTSARDLSTALAWLLVPVARRVAAPWGTDEEVREVLRSSGRGDFDYHFWRAVAWFVTLCLLGPGALVVLVASDIINSAPLERLSEIMIQLVPTALAMLVLASARSGATKRLRGTHVLRAFTAPALDWALLATCLTVTYAGSGTG